MRRVFDVMGMAVSIDIPDCRDDSVFKAAFARLRQIDERFSTYKPDSEVSRLVRSGISRTDLKMPDTIAGGWSGELTEILMACKDFEGKTGGYFSAWVTGVFDPSGYVKGWAIEQAGKIIEAHGHKTYCVGAGGDILARSAYDKIWNIGIQDPRDRSKILNTLSITNGAVATSGSYERGPHIINPITRKPAAKFLSVSINGPNIVTADVLATAVFASETDKPGFMKHFPAYQILMAA